MTKTHRMPGIIGIMASPWYGLPDPPTDGPLPMVLLRHKSPLGPPHLDWMIARGASAGALASWRLPAWPERGATVFPIVATADHDRAWLARQGPVSGGRGSAVRVDAGVLLRWSKVGDEARLSVEWDEGGCQSLVLASTSGVLSLLREAL